VVGARPPRHGDPARRDHRGHPVRLGAPEACRPGAVADRDGDRAGAKRAAPVAVALLRLAAITGCEGLPAKPLFAAKLECDNAMPRTEGLPMYRISGRAGFVWVASFDQRGRGTLRLTAVDASAFTPTTTPRAPIETVEKVEAQNAIADSTNQLSRGDAQKESADGARIDVGRAREDAEARDEAVTKADNDEAAAIERPKVNSARAIGSGERRS
jgi:hypothetical protein